MSSTMFIPLKQIFLKDQQARIYSKSSFFFSSISYIIPFFLVIFTCLSLVFFFLNGLNDDPISNYAWFWYFTVIGNYLGGAALGNFIGVIAKRKEDINTIIPLVALPLFAISGFFVAVKSMTWPLRILSFISILTYNLQGKILNEFRNDEEYTDNCNLTGGSATACDPFSYYDFYINSIRLNFILSLVMLIAIFFLTYVCFLSAFRIKNTKYGYNTEIVKRYARFNPNPRLIE